MAGIRTRFDINLEVDDEIFNVQVRLLTRKEEIKYKKQRKQHENSEAKNDAIRLEHKRDLRKLKDKRAELEDNRELFAIEEDASVRQELILERGELRRMIGELEEKTETYTDPGTEPIDEAVETMAKEQYDLLVSGEDKERLSDFVDEMGIAYATLWVILNTNIAQARKKK